MTKIAIIGAGWYGCHIAKVFSSEYKQDVTLFESKSRIFDGISGQFGIRLHKGPHYPRSSETRKSCREGFNKFIKEYPDLVVNHAYSTYALGTTDSNGNPSKVTIEEFRKVCKESKGAREIKPKEWGYTKEVQIAFNIQEPSILLGDGLRDKFTEYLAEARVTVICNFKVKELISTDTQVIVIQEGSTHKRYFDYAINTTSYQNLLPSPELPLPLNMDIFYQTCIALVYEDKLTASVYQPPFSFIVMDGWFPCIMPRIENKEEELSEEKPRKYIVTHGKFTILGSFKKPEDAYACLKKIDNEYINKETLPQTEAEMKKFWPVFGNLIPGSKERRFKFVGWEGNVLAKMKTNTEFRSTITLRQNRIVYAFPGKVSNVFNAEEESYKLINNQDIIQAGDFQYVKGGALDAASQEITEALDPKIKNTCDLQTFAESKLPKEEKTIVPTISQPKINEEKIIKPLRKKSAPIPIVLPQQIKTSSTSPWSSSPSSPWTIRKDIERMGSPKKIVSISGLLFKVKTPPPATTPSTPVTPTSSDVSRIPTRLGSSL